MKREESKRRVHLLDGASVLVRVSDLQRGMTSHPLTAPNANANDPGIPPDCTDIFLREWLDGSPRMKSSNVPKYRKAAPSGGIFGGKDQKVSEMLAGLPLPEFEKRLRLVQASEHPMYLFNCRFRV